MKSPYLLASVCLLIISTALYAERVYKWIDEKGQTHYGGNPPAGVKATLVKTYGPSMDSTKEIAEREAAKATAEKAAQTTGQPKQTAKATPIPSAADCQAAKDHYTKLSNAPRIRTTNDQGEQVIAGEEERQQMLKEAQAKITERCRGQ